MDYFAEAIQLVGGTGKLAAALGVVQGAVSNWKKRGGVPLEHCATIERLTAGKVTAEQLRAGCWTRVPDPTWPHPLGRPTLDFGKTAHARVALNAAESDSNKPEAPVQPSDDAMNDVARKAA